MIPCKPCVPSGARKASLSRPATSRLRKCRPIPIPCSSPRRPSSLGGRAPAVLRRTVKQANGWFGFALNLKETAIVLAELRKAAGRYHRPSVAGRAGDSVIRRVPLDKATAQRFAELGVRGLILAPRRDWMRSH